MYFKVFALQHQHKTGWASSENGAKGAVKMQYTFLPASKLQLPGTTNTF